MFSEAVSISVRRNNPSSPSIVRAAGCHLYDASGKAYLDMSGGSGAANLGYQRPEIVRAIQRQAEQLIHTGWNIDNPHRHAMIGKLAAMLPYEDASVMGAVTGAEAIEVALKIARAATGRSPVLYFANSFHGKSQGALAVTSNAQFRKHLPVDAPVYPHLSLLDCQGGDASAAAGWAAQFDAYLSRQAAQGALPCAVIVEPIQAAEGIHTVPEWALQCIVERAAAHGVLTVFDEIYTGFGRTGVPFVSRSGLRPDLLVLGKALGNGLPISAVVGDAALVDRLGYGDHSSTFTFNPLACAVACTVLDIYAAEAPWRAAASAGADLKRQLADLAMRDQRIRHVRGEGLMLAFDVVDDAPAARGPASIRLRAELERGGVIARTGGSRASTVKLTPPLVISSSEVTQFFAVLDDALRAIG